MKKNIYLLFLGFIIIFLFNPASLFSQTKTPDEIYFEKLQQLRKSYGIKSKTITRYEAKSGTFESTGIIRGYEEYDREGRLIKCKRFTPDGNLLDSYENSYDINGIKHTTGSYYKDNGELSYTYEYTFNEYNREKEFITYKTNGNNFGKDNYNYDENGFLKEIATKFSDKKEFVSANYRVDKYGNILESINYDNNGVISSKFVYMYDDNSNLIEKKSYKEGGKYSGKSVYEWYPDFWEYSKVTFYDADENYSGKNVYNLNDLNLCSEIVSYNSKDELDFKKVYVYEYY